MSKGVENSDKPRLFGLVRYFSPKPKKTSKNCQKMGAFVSNLGFFKDFYTANILTVLSTAFGSVTCATAIWLYILQPKIAIDLKLYSSVSLNVMCTVVDCNNHCQITVAHVTQPMTVNWL